MCEYLKEEQITIDDKEIPSKEDQAAVERSIKTLLQEKVYIVHIIYPQIVGKNWYGTVASWWNGDPSTRITVQVHFHPISSWLYI